MGSSRVQTDSKRVQLTARRKLISEYERGTKIELEQLKWDSLLYHFVELPEQERLIWAAHAFLVWQHECKLKKKAWR